MKLLKKVFKYLLYTLLFLIVALNVFIVLTGRYYLYNGLAKTYLVGKSGPGIYDLELFPHSEIEKASSPFLWKKHPGFNTVSLTSEEEAYHKKLGSRAFLVFQEDSLVFEKYWGEHTKNSVSNSFSAAKTVVSLLIGIAVDEGKIKSIDEPVGNYIPEFKEQGRDKVTIRHLLLMAAGFDWTESGSNPLGETAEAYYGDDLYGLVTRLKVIETPGKTFNYQSGDTQILGFILEKATGKTVSELTEEKLWKPMGAGHQAYWSLDKENGDEKAYCCLYASPYDFSLLGYLILNNGKIGTKQIVPEWYMKDMVKTPEMATEEGVPNLRYGWHIWTYYNNGNPVYYCRGLKGQYVMAIPKEKRIIVRLGMERDDNFEIPKSKEKDKSFHAINDEKVGHPIDIFKYIKMAERIVNESKAKK